MSLTFLLPLFSLTTSPSTVRQRLLFAVTVPRIQRSRPSHTVAPAVQLTTHTHPTSPRLPAKNHRWRRGSRILRLACHSSCAFRFPPAGCQVALAPSATAERIRREKSLPFRRKLASQHNSTGLAAHVPSSSCLPPHPPPLLSQPTVRQRLLFAVTVPQEPTLAL